MQTAKELKEIVREKYKKIALQEIEVNKASCCGATEPSKKVYKIMADEYDQLDGYAQEADLGLGCGLPTEFAQIQTGDTVIDLGSGAGNDCFIARHETGPMGKVIGIDFTKEMIVRARENVNKLKFSNVEFRQGDIENMPIENGIADVVVSNCVLNLLPSKDKIFQEIHRVLNDEGHFSISDIVLVGELPSALKYDAEMYAGCVAGAIQKQDYLDLIAKAGFLNIKVQKVKPIIIPDDILVNYLDSEALNSFKKGKTGIFSITVFGAKSAHKKSNPIQSEMTCSPGTACC